LAEARRNEDRGSTVEKVYRRLALKLPAALAAAIDWHFFPNPARPYKELGPFNGQRGRIRIFTRIVDCLPIEIIIETGTFRGTTTLFLRHASGLPVHTVEASRRNFYFARRRFEFEDGIRAQCGDSRAFLEELGHDSNATNRPAFFYLDAHWQEDLPLSEELSIITKYWNQPVLMLDDFQVPDDPGYSYDDYGPDRRLSIGYLPDAFLRDFRLFWPRLAGVAETGHRRGYVVAARRGWMADSLAAIPHLREIETIYPA
jgi:hypothetical protein